MRLSKPNTTIWIDMTDLRTWSGTPTGIQRTVYSLAKYFTERARVKFFYFDPSKQFFVECDFPINQSDLWQKDNTTETLIKNWKHYVNKAIPMRARPHAVKVYKRLKKVSRTNKQASLKKSPFQKNDAVVVLGGNWGDDSKGFAESLKYMKQEHGLYIVHMIYDLIPVKYPNYYLPGSTQSYRNYLGKLITFADHLICISKSTQRDLEEYIDEQQILERPQTSVIRLGEDMIQTKASKPSSELKKRLADQFIICVGTIEARKNHSLLYYVVKESLRRQKSIPQILIVGRRGWMTTDIQHMIDSDPETSDKLFILDDVSDQELAWLYENCLFAIYPSMYEGWGLPLAEAAHYGKLCLSSGTSSMPEVLGNLLDYFSPFNTDECLEKILLYATMPEKLQAKEEALSKRVPWTWEKSYEELIRVLSI